jgi:hypothetical protein
VEIDGPAVSALWHAIAEVKQRWSVKNVLSRAPPCFVRHIKPLVPAALAVVSTFMARSLYVYSMRKAWTPAVEALIS